MGFVQAILWGESRRVRDASGTWRQLLDPASLSQLSSSHLDPKVMASVRRRALLLTLARKRRDGVLSQFAIRSRWSLMWAIVGVFAWVPITLCWVLSVAGAAQFVYGAVSFIAAGLIAWAFYRYSNFAEPHHVARVYLSLARCPACGYNLAEIAADERGRRTCPECGACWAKRGR